MHDLPTGNLSLEDMKQEIIAVLEESNWNRAKAARLLGVSGWTLSLQIRKLGIQPPSGEWPVLQRGISGTTIHQEPRVIIGVRKSDLQGHDGPITFQVNMPMNAQIVDGKVSEAPTLFINAKDFGDFLDALPQPRLRIITDLVIQEAKKRFPNSDRKAGEWLGGTRRLLNYRRKRGYLTLGESKDSKTI